jgi:OOP family OmpA-OmpF porin
MNPNKLMKLAAIWVLIAAIPGIAAIVAAQDQQTVKGLIVGRNGDQMIVRGETGSTTVTLTDSTKVEVVKGKFGLRKNAMGMAALVPGLAVEVKALSTGGKLVANEIKFKSDDLKTAHEIQAGLTPTQQQVQANQQQLQATQQQVQANQQGIQQNQANEAALSKRFGELADYDVKGEAAVHFVVNSTTLSPQAKQDVMTLAARAMGLNGYMIQVAGYADSSGNAAHNQELSDRRADAVVSYLQQTCKVPLFRVLAPAAMGTSNPVASNETPEGQAENRRVVIKILVNRGLSGAN